MSAAPVTWTDDFTQDHFADGTYTFSDDSGVLHTYEIVTQPINELLVAVNGQTPPSDGLTWYDLRFGIDGSFSKASIFIEMDYDESQWNHGGFGVTLGFASTASQNVGNIILGSVGIGGPDGDPSCVSVLQAFRVPVLNGPASFALQAQSPPQQFQGPGRYELTLDAAGNVDLTFPLAPLNSLRAGEREAAPRTITQHGNMGAAALVSYLAGGRLYPRVSISTPTVLPNFPGAIGVDDWGYSLTPVGPSTVVAGQGSSGALRH